MQNRPTILELIDAVRDFVEDHLQRPDETSDRFERLITVNALGIIARELELEPSIMRNEARELRRLLGRPGPVPAAPAGLRELILILNAELASRIRAGRAPDGTAAYLVACTEAKLSVASPTFLERLRRP